MNLFEVVQNVVVFSPQTLQLKPFREIWDNDRSKDKMEAAREMSYVYYMADERSDYMYILDPDERSSQIQCDLDFDDDWVIPQYIIVAISFYSKRSETASTRLLVSTRGILNKISKFLDDVDMSAKDNRDKYINDITKITAAVEKIPKLIKALNDIEKEIIREKELKAQSGNKEIGAFDTDEGI